VAVVYYDDVFKLHKAPYRHPESPERLDRVIAGVVRAGGEIKSPNLMPDILSYIKLAHNEKYINKILNLCKYDFSQIDGDTYVSRNTCDAALLAASSVIQSLSEKKPVYLAVRPPGHHAGIYGRTPAAPSQGFCIFNNAAIGALYVGDGAAVVDIDVHHGNGTQEILYDKDLLYVSIHPDPLTLYPGTGFVEEVGEGRGEGFNVNIPLLPGSADDVYIQAVDEIVLPILEQYGPAVVIISLGWDAHKDDHLANLELTLNSYLYTISKLLKYKLIIVLEGGYNDVVLERGSYSLVKLVNGVLEVDELANYTDFKIKNKMEKILKYIKNIQSRYWKLN